MAHLDFLPPLAPCTRTSPRTHPYLSALSSSASSSQSSILSADASSQSSSSRYSQSSQSSVSDSLPSSWEQQQLDYRASAACSAVEAPATAKRTLPQPLARTCTAPAAPDSRQNPRRCPLSNSGRPPPALVRQSERKGQFVDCLVDSATQMVEVIWPTSVPACKVESGKGVLPLRTFIQETLRRSRTSFSTLQVALYYLILIKAHVPSYDFTMEQPEDAPAFRALQCGRRMFLAALILASKYLQDRNYSARAWSKISGLKVCEINTNEMAFLSAVQWRLHIAESLFDKWQDIILHYTPSQQPPSPGSGMADSRWIQWRLLVSRLTPDLEGVDVRRSAQFSTQLRKAHTWPSAPQSPTSPATPITPTPISAAAHLLSSSESTPTPGAVQSLPRFLEPRLDMRPPTPARLGPLPTPSMTPTSTASASCASTPAASVMCAGGSASRRRSMCAAMQAVQCSMASRMTDAWGGVGCSSAAASRRPSLAPSMASTTTMSMNSSPESMVSDAPSLSSRASSISSGSSALSSAALAAYGSNFTPVKLQRLAAMHCAASGRIPPHAKIAERTVEPDIIDVDGCEGITIEPMSCSPEDFSAFHIDDMGGAQLSRVDSSKSDASSVASSATTDSACSPLRMGVSLYPTAKDARLPRSCFADLVHKEHRQQNRKRGRSSAELTTLEQNVRSLLVPETQRAAAVAARHQRPAYAQDVAMDDVVAVPCTPPAASLLATTKLERRLPVQLHGDGRKRACCAREVVGATVPASPLRGGVALWN